MPTIIDAFDEYFEMLPAISDDLKKEVYKLRYQVYCIETGFEDPANHQDEAEYDDFDDSSIHYLIRHKRFDTYAATTRLILPNKKNPERLFPIELHSQIQIPEAFKGIPRMALGEVSRFCVSKDFKRRKKESGTLTGISPDTDAYYSEDERRTFPHITIALIACLVKISAEHGIDYWYAVMEPALLRFLSTLGIHFIHIGPLTDYHGKRQPGIIKVSDLLEGVAKKNPELLEMLTFRGQYLQSFN
ncbi:PEP-CTERM/exosortase system-associated acyltransferase [Methylomonas albis]|uniref:PEP-CTERM/exosortase system-associated acyltransferase n=1 Tax=Methylomonas albis TaxID=1854563 RepID=A0ABR9D4M9_9GAMM|nr:PEP-CTERM/exosortase system-associated acyltransferase [Methylomonas albis]MBD9357741.1 PEP-CTERM/exosortase system-associated acyltransferase [Methylomonas albis]